MKKSYQEKILEVYKSFDAVADCFAISRIETQIGSLSQSAGFNASARDKSEKLYAEMNAILEKYKDVIQSAKGYEWMSAGGEAWVQGQVGLPVKVEITSIDWNEERAEIRTRHQEVRLPFDRLFETEEECPCR